MQVLKEDIRQAILDGAMGEFEEKGFHGASMRSIAGKCGITAGNLYRYFDGKESLFEALVGPAYNSFIEQVRHTHNSLEESERTFVDTGSLDDEGMDRLIDLYGETISSILVPFRRQVLLLYDGSHGTRFQSAPGRMLEFVTSQVEEHLENFYRQENRQGDMVLARVIAHSYIEGFMDIIRNTPDDHRIHSLCMDFNRLFWTGFLKVIV